MGRKVNKLAKFLFFEKNQYDNKRNISSSLLFKKIKVISSRTKIFYSYQISEERKQKQLYLTYQKRKNSNNSTYYTETIRLST